jgi:hypothetical protein
MNAKQIKDEIRKLNRIDKMEIYRWVEVQPLLFSRIGMYRSNAVRQGAEPKCRVIS